MNNNFVILNKENIKDNPTINHIQTLHDQHQELISPMSFSTKNINDEEMNTLIQKEAEIEHLKFQIDKLKCAYLEIPSKQEQQIIFNNVITKKTQKEQMLRKKQYYLNQIINKKLENDTDEQLYKKVQKYMSMTKKLQLKKNLINQFMTDPNNDKYCTNLSNYFLEDEYNEIY